MEELVEAVKVLQKRILKILLIVVLVIIGLAFSFLENPKPFVLGVIFGAAISGLNFYELGNTLRSAVNMSPEKAQGFTALKYFLRYIVTGVVIFISIVAPYINVLGTIVGLAILKLIIIIYNLIRSKEV